MGYGNKVTETREYIHEEIVLGNYSRGTALPPEREMAERAGVSYMTLRKAVDLLVAEGCLNGLPESGPSSAARSPKTNCRGSSGP